MVTESDYKALQEDYRTSSKGDANHYLNYAIRCLDVRDGEQYQLECDHRGDGHLHSDYYHALVKAKVITDEMIEHATYSDSYLLTDLYLGPVEYLNHIWNPQLFLDDFSTWEGIVLDESYQDWSMYSESSSICETINPNNRR
tara:strand:- start:708 stop:1133 length:426 start_codon:yes stop_codon:yes gene_type:complete